ncbi:MAG: 5,10-methylenetetrahydromethanopterin reductase [Nitrososphaeria archaeon]|nr:5,10-methylenetetrahydromethanopterin reductase [Nitrososphaeria archaeon]NIN51578.1 5,10-methylenetetrahydromethanopterin reductase [Nitrososphaeria archaeon]NIQ32063.1 5,10-methylenetetrahydromethanopterin reductase [Nitrososphaeria archaeon]
MVKFGIEFVPDTAPKKIIDNTIAAERGGFKYVWITDHYCNRNPYIVLTAIALNTEMINLGPGVTNPYVISPAWTASAVASLDEISGERAILGLGAGDKVTLAALGIAFKKPLTTIKESVEVTRRLWKGEPVKYEGDMVQLDGANMLYKASRDIPIYVGAQGPKMLELAGRIGDGILINAAHPMDFEYAVKQIRKGVESGGKDMSDVDVVAYASFSVDHDAKKAKKKVVPIVAFIVAGSQSKILERHDIPVEEATKISDALGKGDFGGAFQGVTDEMVEAFSIYGTPEECAERIEGLVEMGVTQVVIGSPIGPKKKISIDLIAKEIIPKF